MLIVDLNLLIHAVDSSSPRHAAAKAWLEQTLDSGVVLGLPWVTLLGFVRITTNRRINAFPKTVEEALKQIEEWLALPCVTILEPGPEHFRYFAEVCRAVGATGNLVTDAHYAALALEHDCELASSDTDFALFPKLR